MLVEERMAEAAAVLRRLPEPRLQGYFNLWPAVRRSAEELAAMEPRPLRVAPSPAAISRMEETLSWTVGLDPIDSRIVWLRASGARWKTICHSVGLQRSAAHEHWRYALCAIAWRLNWRNLPKLRSRRHVIELVNRACGDDIHQQG